MSRPNEVSLDMEHSKISPTVKIDVPPLRSRLFLQLSSCCFYGVSSFLIIVINKMVLTHYKFPSPHVLGIGQMLITLLVLYTANSLKVVHFPPLTRDIPKKIWPLPLFYIGNIVCGLGGTKHLSLPMFTVLRRFTILLTLVGEFYILGVRPNHYVVGTVLSMVGGAMIAALDDLTFDLIGYVFVLSNDVFTAANNIYVKKKLQSRDLGKYGLLFYNALFMLVPLISLSFCTDDFEKAMNFDGWDNFGFVICFFTSCFMGFLLMYSTVLCTSYNSALTTTIVGVLKNILITYIGMYIGGDYVFSWPNFLGLNLSMAGSLVYSYLTFKKGPGTSSTEQKTVNVRG